MAPDLRNCDFSYLAGEPYSISSGFVDKRFVTLDLSEADLSGANLAGLELSFASMEGANLTNANLTDAFMERVNLTGANLSGANLTDAFMQRIILRGANLTGANLYRALIYGEQYIPRKHDDNGYLATQEPADLRRANLTGANLAETVLSGADFSGANLTNAILSRADLGPKERSGISAAQLTGSNLSNAELIGANLTEVRMNHSALIGANLGYAILRNAELQFSDFTGADLTGADLTGADLTGANLTGANLSGADLTGADLRGAVLDGAFLETANLDDVSGYSTTNTVAWRNCASGGVCVVGDRGPGGGIVFYVHPGGGTFASPGSDCGRRCKYLEAAPSDQGSEIAWCSNTDSSLSVRATGIGSGMANTTTADRTCTSGAIQIAADYSNKGKTDWHLPSILELQEMCKYANYQVSGDVGVMCEKMLGFPRPDFASSGTSEIAVGRLYWSSSESSATDALHQGFLYGGQGQIEKKYTLLVRPVRAF